MQNGRSLTLSLRFPVDLVDNDTYENDEFDEDEAQDIKTASQLKKQQELLAASSPLSNDDEDGNDALDLGEDYDEDEED